MPTANNCGCNDYSILTAKNSLKYIGEVAKKSISYDSYRNELIAEESRAIANSNFNALEKWTILGAYSTARYSAALQNVNPGSTHNPVFSLLRIFADVAWVIYDCGNDDCDSGALDSLFGSQFGVFPPA